MSSLTLNSPVPTMVSWSCPRRLTSILITRFLLNLRQLAHTSERTSAETTQSAVISTRFPSVHLSADVLGDMGAPLRSGFDGDTTEVSFEEKLQYANEPLLAGLVHLEGVSQQEDVVEMDRFV